MLPLKIGGKVWFNVYNFSLLLPYLFNNFYLCLVLNAYTADCVFVNKLLTILLRSEALTLMIFH